MSNLSRADLTVIYYYRLARETHRLSGHWHCCFLSVSVVIYYYFFCKKNIYVFGLMMAYLQCILCTFVIFKEHAHHASHFITSGLDPPLIITCWCMQNSRSECARTFTQSLSMTEHTPSPLQTVRFTFTDTNVHAHTWILMAEHVVGIISLKDSSTEAQCRRKRKQQNTYCILYEETGDWRR